ncbi:MAG TPA: hypothetical protein VIF37_02930 [Methylobacter sp.]
MDEAFTRRFQAMIYFTMPAAAQRLELWQNAFAATCELEDDVDLEKSAEDYELAGGAIINVLRYCALSAVSRGSRRVSRDELLAGIRREFRKDNRTFESSSLSCRTICMDAGGTTPRMGEVESRLELRSRAPTVGALGNAEAVAERVREMRY